MGTLLAASEELVLRLPLPLAQLHRRALNSKTALERHQAAYYLWEASLKLLASSALVEYASLGDQDPGLREKLKNLARPSLGHWWELTRMLLPILADSERSGVAARRARDLILGRQRDDLPRSAGLDSLLREVLESSSGSRSTVRLSELFDRLVRYRNRELGHGAAGHKPQDFYERMGRALLHATEEVLALVDVLLGSSLIFVSEVRRQASGTWLVERYELRGESPRRIESLEVPDSEKDSLPHPGRVHLQSSGGLRSLHPLVFHDLESGEFFFLNARRQKSRAEYLSYSTGRVVDRGDLEADRRELLGQLLGAGVAEEEVKEWAERSERDEPEAAFPAPAIARRCIGEFEVLSRIGRGGMGVVYRAWQPSLSRQVALKCLLGSGDPRTEARFAREIRALGRVDHPNLVKVYSSGSEGDQWFYAMELIEGADVASVLEHLASTSSGEVGETEWERALSTACIEARRKEESVGSSEPSRPPAASGESPAAPRPNARTTARSHIEQAISIARQAAEAAHALHEAGVIHRDIKPGNIMLTSDGSHAVLMDLGVAQLADEAEGRLTRTRQFLGTLRYASPEQVLAAGSLDRRSDVYSLGATLFELLTLKPLFGATDETSPPDLMLKIQSADPGKPSRLNSRVPRDLDAIVLKCLEKDRARRYGTARELAEDLARYERGEAVEAQPPTIAYLLAKSIRRHRKRYALVAVLLIAAFLGVAFAFWRIERAWKVADTALFDSYTDTGIKAGLEGKSGTALLWFSRASEVARGDAYRQRMNRIRQRTFAKDIPRTLRALPHPGERIGQLSFHPGSAHLLVGSEAGKCTIWDLVKEEKLPLPGGERTLGRAAWSPGGEMLLLATPEGDVGLFAWPSGKRLTGPPASGELRAFAWSKDGRRLALSTDQVRVWDLEKAAFLEREFEHPAPVAQVRFDEKGERLLTAAEDRKARLFAVGGSGKAEPLFPPVPHLKPWIRPPFLDRGRAILTASKWDTATRWDARTGRMLGSTTHLDWITNLLATDDGGLYLVVQQLRVELREGRSGRAYGMPIQLEGIVSSVSFSPDGSMFLTAGADRALSLWEIPDDYVPGPRDSLQNIAARPAAIHTLGLRRAAWSSDGRFVAIAEEGGLVRSEALPIDEHEVRVQEGFQDTGLTLSADTRLVFPVGQRLSSPANRCESRVFETATGNPLGPYLHQGGILTGGALSLNGSLAVTLSCLEQNGDDREKTTYLSWERRGWIRFWDAKNGKEVFPAIAAPAEPLDIAMAPDGGLFAVALASGRILLVNAATGEPTSVLEHGERVHNAVPCLQGMLGFSPDGKSLATWNFGRSLKVWDIEGRGLRFSPLTHDAPVQIARFSPDGQMLLAAGGLALTVWDASSGGRLSSPVPHPARILHAVFRSDGERILTACEDGRVRLWDWKQGRLAAPELPHSRHTPSAHFLLDPDLVLTNGVGMTPHVWEVQTGKLLAPPRLSKASFVSQTFLIEGGRRAVLGGSGLALHPLDDFVGPGRDDGREASPHLLARVLSGERLDAGGLATPLSQQEWLEDWRALRREHPLECAFDPSRERTVEWHRMMVDRMEKRLFWDSARWHLERLRDLGERVDESRFLRFERFVRAWRFAEASRPWDRFGPVPELSPEDIRAIEASALQIPLFRSRFPFVSFIDRYFATPRDAVGYALRTMRSPSPRKLKLLVGSDDGVRIWLDGALIHQYLFGRGAVADQDEAWMDLPAGEHRILVEVTQTYGDWRLYLRFEDEAGRELRLTDEGDLEVIPGE